MADMPMNIYPIPNIANSPFSLLLAFIKHLIILPITLIIIAKMTYKINIFKNFTENLIGFLSIIQLIGKLSSENKPKLIYNEYILIPI